LTLIRIKTSQPAQIATATLAQAVPVIKLDTSRVTGRASGLVLARYRSAREVLFYRCLRSTLRLRMCITRAD
jgi:hypothetical protein